ncbi:hypothetical protein SCOCK_110142 [Actinacidiphila cocklensis]|uniref:Uncharacterized protein n=1 Tax=Actinacidiphila cocklensis TaxID=887465 RepID=A0A9W4DJF4_9ACTN|nr:hypothetical protein SCOCK_110142 [Actinacidiphila cocklensis]
MAGQRPRRRRSLSGNVDSGRCRGGSPRTKETLKNFPRILTHRNPHGLIVPSDRRGLHLHPPPPGDAP